MYKPALVLALCVFILSACGSRSANPAVDKQAKQAGTQAQKIVEKCATGASFFSKAGRETFVRCVAPPGHKAQFERCALNSVKSHLSLNIKKDEAALTTGAETCLEKYR